MFMMDSKFIKPNKRKKQLEQGFFDGRFVSRCERPKNKYNRKKKTYGNGDGKDAAHRGSKIKGFVKASVNRANNRPRVRRSR